MLGYVFCALVLGASISTRAAREYKPKPGRSGAQIILDASPLQPLALSRISLNDFMVMAHGVLPRYVEAEWFGGFIVIHDLGLTIDNLMTFQ